MNKLKKLDLIFFLFFNTSNASYCQVKLNTYAKSKQFRVVNTTWYGEDSDGDFYEFTFLKGGKVCYKTNTSRGDTVQFSDKEDRWFQSGSTLVILLGNASVRKGTINGNFIDGNAWNDKGHRWAWKLKKKIYSYKNCP